jgi:DNA phosphorothioation-dependent restriction protein DptG
LVKFHDNFGAVTSEYLPIEEKELFTEDLNVISNRVKYFIQKFANSIQDESEELSSAAFSSS